MTSLPETASGLQEQVQLPQKNLFIKTTCMTDNLHISEATGRLLHLDETKPTGPVGPCWFLHINVFYVGHGLFLDFLFYFDILVYSYFHPVSVFLPFCRTLILSPESSCHLVPICLLIVSSFLFVFHSTYYNFPKRSKTSLSNTPPPAAVCMFR